MLLTREACRQKEEEIRKLREKLNEVRREKGEQVAQAPGDNRHDNFGLEQAEIQERAIMNEIRELDAQLKKCINSGESCTQEQANCSSWRSCET